MVVYLGSVFASAVGVSWTSGILGSVAEAMLLVAIAGVAWRRPQQSDAPPQRS